MKKFLSVLTALTLVAMLCMVASAGAIEGFTAAQGHEDLFNMKDEAISCKSAGNPILLYNTDTKNADYTVEVKVKPSSDSESYAVVGVGSTTTWIAGLFLKLSNKSAELYDFSTGAFVGMDMKKGVTVASLKITSDYNDVKIVKKSGKYSIYVNNVLAYENVAPADTKDLGTKISLGANNTKEVECFFKDFKYSLGAGSTTSTTTNNTETADNMTVTFISVISMLVAAAGVYCLKAKYSK